MGKTSESVAHKTLVDGSEVTLHSHAGGGGSFFYTPKYVTWTMGSTGWNDKSLSGEVSANALCFIVVENTNAAVEYNAGVREKGSSDNKYFDLHEAEAGGVTPLLLTVKADSSSVIQCYAENTSSVRFTLIGYMV